MKILVPILLISILIISGCIEQKSNIDSSKIRAIQTPNISEIESIKKLEKIGDNDSIKGLISKFADKDEQIQQYAMVSVVNIGESAVEPLIQSLKDQDSNIRICSAIVLGKIGDKRAIEPVKQLLNDSNDSVKTEAMAAYNELIKNVNINNTTNSTRK